MPPWVISQEEGYFKGVISKVISKGGLTVVKTGQSRRRAVWQRALPGFLVVLLLLGTRTGVWAAEPQT